MPSTKKSSIDWDSIEQFWKRHRVVMLIISIAILDSLVIAIAYSRGLPLFREVFAPFVISLTAGALVVLVGVRSIKEYLQDREKESESRKLRTFWSPPSESIIFNLIFGAEKSRSKTELEPRIPYATAYAISEIKNCFDVIFGQSITINRVIAERDTKLRHDLFAENVIFFGGELSVRQFGTFSKAIDVPYYQTKVNSRQRAFQYKSPSGPRDSIRSQIDNNFLRADVATITRVINRSNNRLIFLFNGNFGAGLLASVFAATRFEHKLHGFDPDAPAQQLVVEVSGIVDNLVDHSQKVEVLRPWRSFQIPEGAIDTWLNREAVRSS